MTWIRKLLHKSTNCPLDSPSLKLSQSLAPVRLRGPDGRQQHEQSSTAGDMSDSVLVPPSDPANAPAGSVPPQCLNARHQANATHCRWGAEVSVAFKTLAMEQLLPTPIQFRPLLTWSEGKNSPKINVLNEPAVSFLVVTELAIISYCTSKFLYVMCFSFDMSLRCSLSTCEIFFCN